MQLIDDEMEGVRSGLFSSSSSVIVVVVAVVVVVVVVIVVVVNMQPPLTHFLLSLQAGDRKNNEPEYEEVGPPIHMKRASGTVQGISFFLPPYLPITS